MTEGGFAVSFQQSFKALADPTRRQILELLREGPRTAGEIGGRFPMTLTVMDQLLALAASFRRE